MAEERLTLNCPDEVVVRMYGQGFGDCFLLAFPRQPAQPDPAYVVIDCGVFFRTPGDRERMRAVVRSIRAATGGTVDLLVVTHEHHDHLCGFEYARDEWKQIGVGRIWLAWTEDDTHPATQEYDREKEALRLQVEWALQLARAYQDQDPALARGLRQIEALTGFAGDDGEPAGGGERADSAARPAAGRHDGASSAGARLRPPQRLSKLPDLVLDDLAREPGKRFNPAGPKTERDFCEPGQVRAVPGTAVDAYVLGPPTALARLAQEFEAGEVYPEAEGEAAQATSLAALRQRIALVAASERAEREGLGAALRRRSAAADDTAAEPNDPGAPFSRSFSLPYVGAREHPFFREAYFAGRADRQIETDWLRGTGRIALQADRVINNTSLALAFRLPDKRVLLFAGDAQVGNWLSWHEIQRKDWRRPDGGQVSFRPTAAELLAQTCVYKVGHHGSHNATLRARGLEQMPDDLIAFVPTSRVFPQEQNDWTIPLPTLLDALWRKSGGQVVFPHEHPDYDYSRTAFMRRVETSQEKFEPMRRKVKGKEKLIEEGVPLWRQVRIGPREG